MMNLIMGSSTSAISASVRTPGMCTYPSLSNAAIISGVTVYSSPSMPPSREEGAFGEVDADIGTRRAAREASARGIDGSSYSPSAEIKFSVDVAWDPR